MDEGLTHGKMCPVLKTEQKRHPSPCQTSQTNQWESGESDTESLAQERAYQQQLRMNISQHGLNKYMFPQKENAGGLQQGDGEDEDANNDETEDLQVYDSLEVASNPHAKRNPTLLQIDHLDTQTGVRGGRHRLLSDDAYSDLRYDPNWRTKLKGYGCFNKSPQISVEEYYQVPEETSSQSSGDRQGLEIKGGYRYMVDTGPAVMVPPHMAANESHHPYCLHPQDGQTSSLTSAHSHNQVLQCSSPGSDNISQRGSREKRGSRTCDSAGENLYRFPEITEDIHAAEFQTHYQQEPRCTQGEPIQKMCTSAPTSIKVLSNKKKIERLMEDIVERNKITLGLSTSKYGSYVRVHAPKQEMPHNVNQVHEPLQETTSTQKNQQDSSDPEVRWLQKTQQLQVTQISKGKKAQRKEYPNPSRQPQPPALAVKAVRRDSLSSPLANPAAVTQTKPQKTTSSQPLPPTIRLNISLNTSSHLLSLLQQKGQDAIINLASLHGHPHWNPASEVQLALSPGYQQTNPGKSSHMYQEGPNAQLYHQKGNPKEWQRTTALKWLISCEGEDQPWSSDEVHTKQFPQNLLRTSPPASSRGLGSYTVLPPVRKPMTKIEPKLSPGQTVNTTYPIHRSSSDSYLVQMEKQKQLKARATYKLRTDISLHPDHTAIEKTKMKRQKLHSNVIRKQNKNISRSPLLPAKDPEGSDKKVPRIKALEYAKTIAKPSVQSQPKQRQKYQSEGLTEHAPYLHGLDVSQMTTLELLRKRHEEEKQTVAVYRKVHAV